MKRGEIQVIRISSSYINLSNERKLCSIFKVFRSDPIIRIG